MWVKKTKRRAIVKKKNVKAQSKIEEEAPEVGMVGVGAGNGWVTFEENAYFYFWYPCNGFIWL